jgi:hypothetical protein
MKKSELADHGGALPSILAQGKLWQDDKFEASNIKRACLKKQTRQKVYTSFDSQHTGRLTSK